MNGKPMPGAVTGSGFRSSVRGGPSRRRVGGAPAVRRRGRQRWRMSRSLLKSSVAISSPDIARSRRIMILECCMAVPGEFSAGRRRSEVSGECPGVVRRGRGGGFRVSMASCGVGRRSGSSPGCGFGAEPGSRGLSRRKPLYEQPEDGLVRAGGGQPHRHGAGAAGHHRTDAKQPQTKALALRPGQTRPAQGRAAHRFEQRVRQPREQQPVLVRPPLRARSAVGEQGQLLFLDPVLHVCALTVHPVIEFVRFPFKVGDDEAQVASLRGVFDAGDDPPATPPSPRRILEVVERPALGPGRLEAVPGHLARHRRLAFEHRIASQPHDVSDIVALAPVETSGAGRTPSPPETRCEPQAMPDATS